MITPQKALHRLREGNRRYASATPRPAGPHRFIDQQNPFAVVLGCADSRVPVEAVFDRPAGDLFVIRVAGNIAGPSQIGSIEYAVATFAPPLIVVLGHTRCGAVDAVLSALETPVPDETPHLSALVDRLTPTVRDVADRHGDEPREARIRAATYANARATAEELPRRSPLLRRHVDEERLHVVPAVFALETGLVDFLASDVGKAPLAD